MKITEIISFIVLFYCQSLSKKAHSDSMDKAERKKFITFYNKFSNEKNYSIDRLIKLVEYKKFDESAFTENEISIWGEDYLKEGKNRYINSFILFIFHQISNKINKFEDYFNSLMPHLSFIRKQIIFNKSLDYVYDDIKTKQESPNYILFRSIYNYLQNTYKANYENNEIFNDNDIVKELEELKKSFIGPYTDKLNEFKERLSELDRVSLNYSDQHIFASITPIFIDSEFEIEQDELDKIDKVTEKEKYNKEKSILEKKEI